MIKCYKVSEGGVQQFKAELKAIFNGIRENPFLHFLMVEVMSEIMGEEEEDSESKSVS